MMHQSEFHAASVVLSRAEDKRKSLINIPIPPLLRKATAVFEVC